MADAPPTAFIGHATPGRLRLRVPTRKHDARFFECVEEAVASWDAVASVQTNPVTAGILIHHAGEVQALAQRAANAELFVVRPPRSGPTSFMDRLLDRLTNADARIQAATGGTHDLESTLFLSLVAAGAIQVARGQPLGAASSLLWSAASIILGRRALTANASVPDD